jgi:hypothetical protein
MCLVSSCLVMHYSCFQASCHNVFVDVPEPDFEIKRIYYILSVASPRGTSLCLPLSFDALFQQNRCERQTFGCYTYMNCIVTYFINALPGNGSLSAVQHATIEQWTGWISVTWYVFLWYVSVVCLHNWAEFRSWSSKLEEWVVVAEASRQ